MPLKWHLLTCLLCGAESFLRS